MTWRPLWISEVSDCDCPSGRWQSNICLITVGRWGWLRSLLIGAAMGWNNPPVRWAELERVLSGRVEHRGDGGDSPAWTRHRDPYEPPPLPPAQIRPHVP